EREADRIADAVTDRPGPAAPPAVGAAPPAVRRQEVEPTRPTPPTTWPPQEVPTPDQDEKKLKDAAGKFGAEVAKQVATAFADSETGKAVLGAAERDFKPVTDFLKKLSE